MPVRGFRDIKGDDFLTIKSIENQCQQNALQYNFEEISMPMLESIDVFYSNLGDQSDVVSKEMYTLSDKNDKTLVLRPEFTAPICRMFVENNYHKTDNIYKLFTSGPVFRYSRPQKGRYRQFFQANYEIIGCNNPTTDADNIALCSNTITQIIGKNKVTLEINYLPSKEGMTKYSNYLREFFKQHKESLSNYANEKIETSPIRIIDSKFEQDRQIINKLDSISNFLSEDDIKIYDKIKKTLDILGISYIHNDHLVRGLDYYNGIVFEFLSNDIGESQSAVAAGGRYDGLINNFIDKEVNKIPSFGFAIGIDRLSLLVEKQEKQRSGFCIFTTKEDEEIGLKFLHNLRKLTNCRSSIISSDMNISKKLNKADKLNFQIAIILDKNEIEKSYFTTKNFTSNENIQHESIDILAKYISLNHD